MAFLFEGTRQWVPSIWRSTHHVARRRESAVIVVKFGGTSLAGTDRMRAAARIVAAHRRDEDVVCVVSAMAGITDALLTLVETTSTGTITRAQMLTALRTRHETTMQTLTTTSTVAETTYSFATRWDALERDLRRLDTLSRDGSPEIAHARAAFSGWGERLSTLLFAAALESEHVPSSVYQDEPVVLDDEDVGEMPGPANALAPREDALWQALHRSATLTREALSPAVTEARERGRVIVVPGYVARTPSGLVTTLGRNGSDLSAAIVAAALNVSALYIYGDVHGVHRADPRIIPGASLLPALTYADAAEIASLGARVLHPAALIPLAATGIPLRLRSSLDPGGPGTEIGNVQHVRNVLNEHVLHAGNWVVVAHPVTADHATLDLEEIKTSDLVEVQGVMLAHQELRPDRHARRDVNSVAASSALDPHEVPVSSALALLRRAPRPIGLALSPRRVTVVVPSSESVAIQRRLYTALSRSSFRVASRAHFRAASAQGVPAWEQTP